MPSPNYTPFYLGPSWQEVLQEELKKPYIATLAAFVEEERQLGPVYPKKELVFEAFLKTPFDQVKAVIVGQDPYHGKGQAHGLSFSVPPGVVHPPSLKNIFKELETDLNIPIPTSGCLLPWAEQGILMLNATLTVQEGKPLSHHNRGWETFTDAVLNALQKRKEPIAFLLWGKSAQEKCRFLKEETSSHLILTAAHPSPFSCHSGFFNCCHFSQLNLWLKSRGEKEIEWKL